MFPLRDSTASETTPIVNWLLIAANIFVFLFFEVSLPEAKLEDFITTYGIVPSRLIGNFHLNECGTIISSMFLHGGWFHLISNMWALYIFGDNIEDRLGHLGYFIFYMLCGIIAGLSQAYMSSTSNLPTIGASGAIGGVLGAYMLLFPRGRIQALMPAFVVFYTVEIPALVYSGFWFFSQWFIGLYSLGDTAANQGSIAWWAHIGGFASGLLLVKLFEKRQKYNEEQHYTSYNS